MKKKWTMSGNGQGGKMSKGTGGMVRVEKRERKGYKKTCFRVSRDQFRSGFYGEYKIVKRPRCGTPRSGTFVYVWQDNFKIYY